MISPASKLPQLYGQIVLIAEPNALIAMDLAATFSGWGAVPVLYHDLDGPAQLAAPALAKAALVDLPFSCEPLSGLIAALRQHGVPTALTTAGSADGVGGEFPGLPVFDKPVDYAVLAHWLGAVAASSECQGKPATGD